MVKESKPWTHWLLKLQGLILLTVLLGVIGVRFNFLPFRAAFSVFGYSLLGAIFVSFIALLILVWCWWKRASHLRLHAAISAVIGIVPLLVILATVGPKNFSVPPINDITTDTDNPPVFEAAKKVRVASENSLKYAGDSIASLQLKAYPDVKPLVTDLPYIDAYKHALAVVKQLGWHVLAEDMQTGIIEATEQTRLFAFKDDVAIRVVVEGGGSRVDIRSASRLGKSDLGANAARIRRFQAAYKN